MSSVTSLGSYRFKVVVESFTVRGLILVDRHRTCCSAGGIESVQMGPLPLAPPNFRGAAVLFHLVSYCVYPQLHIPLGMLVLGEIGTPSVV